MREKTINILLVIAALFVGIIGTYSVMSSGKGEAVSTVNKNVTITSDDSINESVEKVFDSVVVISNYRNGRLAGYGSGFVYKKDDKTGYIMTNDHVVEGATELKVTFSNDEEASAKLLGTDSYMDVAVLSVSASDILSVAEIGDSTKAKIGDTIFTVGTPISMDYAGTVTKGIISGQSREITVTKNDSNYMMEAIQVDASINPGNSGGPLANINGEVIGVNSVKLVENSIEGMGFAIPIEVAMSQVDKLENGEKIERPLIGVSTYDPVNSLSSDSQGVIVGAVQSGSDCEKAGLKEGDIILKFDGVKIKSSAHLKYLLYKHNLGDEIKMVIKRDNKEKELTLKLTHKLGD